MKEKIFTKKIEGPLWGREIERFFQRRGEAEKNLFTVPAAGGREMERREFIRTLLMLSAAAFLPWNGLIGAAEGAAAADLAVCRGAPPEKATRAAVEALGGMRRFVGPGDVVVVKPNIGWDRAPEFGANTHPRVVAEVVRLCREAGAKRVRVMDNPVADPQRCYRHSGIAEAAARAGGEVVFMEERRFREVRLSGLGLRSWPVYRDVLEADKVINLPVAKTHGSSVLTLGMKNWMGAAGGWRGRMHLRLHESIVDLALLIRPALVVLDATRIMVANGPQGGALGDVRRLDTVVAGTDQVAVDAFAAALFGLRPQDVPYIALAQQAGLGRMELKGRVRHLSL